MRRHVNGPARPRAASLLATLAGALTLAGLPATGLAHPGEPIAPHDLWSAWSWDPLVLTTLAASAWLYSRGLRELWRRAPGRGVTPVRAACFAFGWLALAVALVSPLHAMGEALLSAHMVQHELLVAVGTPLLVLGRPLLPWLWALPRGVRVHLGRASRAADVQRSWRAVAHPVTAWVLHSAALWLWHLPAPYQLTVRSELAHAVQHTSFVATALLFWWTVLERRRTQQGVAMLSLFGMGLHTGVLGALLALSPLPWYAVYGSSAPAWGLTPLEDQQLAGLVMWVPACAAYVAAGLWLAALWMRAGEQRVLQREMRQARERVVAS